MRPIRKRRLQLVALLVAGVSIATVFVALALHENINLFYSPAQIAAGEAPLDREIMAGGLVVPGSVERHEDSLYVEFLVTDNAAEARISYEGILPDLFDEGQGIVAVGRMNESGIVEADQVLAKHDENYMPPAVMDAMQESIEEAGHPGQANY
jgi:cytochrome c-type biogenesis protein CcmE